MTFRSSHPDVAIPDTPYSSFILHRAPEHANQPVLVDGPSGRTLTIGQVAGGACRVAAGLARRGFAKGNVLAIYSPNLPEYALAFHGPVMAGGIVTTANPLSTPDELAFQLRDPGARYLVTAPPFLDKAREAARGTPVKEIFVFGEAEGATPFAALLAGDDDAPAVRIDPDRDLAALPYSSGTAGRPKGVMLTHRNLVAVTLQVEAQAQLDESWRTLGILRQASTPAELMEWVAGRVAPHKRIRRLAVVEAIPKSASGKILRRVLVEQERASRAAG